MTTRHIVTATMIVAKIPGAQGGETYLRKGRLLPATVDDAEVDRLTELGLIEPIEVADPDPIVDDEPDEDEVLYPEGAPSEDWKGGELDAYAVKHGVDLKGKTTKADKVAAILAAAQ